MASNENTEGGMINYNAMATQGSVSVRGDGEETAYTGMLIASGVFYLIAVVATLAEMAPYCTGFISDWF